MMVSDWAISLKNWLFNPQNSDQEIKGKLKFIKVAKAGSVTKLSCVGISNGVLRKKANEFYKLNKKINFNDLITGIDYLWQNCGITEAHVICSYILSKYKKLFDHGLWELICNNWIDKLDHWISADHLCMDVLSYFPLLSEQYLKEIKKWKTSDKFWIRRLSIVCLIKMVRENIVATQVLINQLKYLIEDKNYYVRKAIPWILREASKSNPNGVEEFILTNIENMNKTEIREASKKLNEEIVDKLLTLYTNKINY